MPLYVNTSAKIGNEQAWNDRASLVRTQGLEPIASTAASRSFPTLYPKQRSNCSSAFKRLRCWQPRRLCELSVKLWLKRIYVKNWKDFTSLYLLLQGVKPPYATVSDAQYMVNHIRSNALFEIDASHISNIEQPEAFNQAILDFYCLML